MHHHSDETRETVAAEEWNLKIIMTGVGIKHSDFTHPHHQNHHQTLPHNCHNFWNYLHQYSGTPGYMFSPKLPGPQVTQIWRRSTEKC